MADMKKRLETEAAVLRTIEARRRNGDFDGHILEGQIIDRHLKELAQHERRAQLLGDPFTLGARLARGLERWER